ncbi:hypothetical protein HU200_029964 [Digitaria exilis]|uniref:AP2/ERF domain-containing protein n=1 Tax=Digitaria exilis TaxID=1010633 RepID=A0A835ESH4_9POAL|nr:hypothetical protein HU200_029964 [Digitaria exilis]
MQQQLSGGREHGRATVDGPMEDGLMAQQRRTVRVIAKDGEMKQLNWKNAAIAGAKSHGQPNTQPLPTLTLLRRAGARHVDHRGGGARARSEAPLHKNSLPLIPFTLFDVPSPFSFLPLLLYPLSLSPLVLRTPTHGHHHHPLLLLPPRYLSCSCSGAIETYAHVDWSRQPIELEGGLVAEQEAGDRLKLAGVLKQSLCERRRWGLAPAGPGSEMVLDLNVASPEDSGTSSSSVLNSGDGGFRFGLLGSPVDDDDCSGEMAPAASSGFMTTRQLFPAPTPPADPEPAAAPVPVWQPRRAEDLGVAQKPAAPAKKTRRGPRSRSSQYRGVTFYRRTGRWESHIWDCGKQVYLGGFDTAHAAARAYDRAAIKFRGLEADINFSLGDYEDDLKQVMVASIDFFSFPVLLVGFGRAYDRAALRFNGREAVTNFEPSSYSAGDALPDTENEAIADVDAVDLDLRISQPNVQDTKRDNTLAGLQPTCDSPKSSNTMTSQPMSSSSPWPMYHQSSAVPSHHQQRLYSSACPGFFPNNQVSPIPLCEGIITVGQKLRKLTLALLQLQERPMERRPELGPQSFPTWAWQMRGSPHTPLHHSAASSGFSTAVGGANGGGGPLPSPHPPAPLPNYQFFS